MKKVRLFAVAAAMGMFASTVAAAETTVAYNATWGEVDEIVKVDVGDKVVAPTTTIKVVKETRTTDATENVYVDGLGFDANETCDADEDGDGYTDSRIWFNNDIHGNTSYSFYNSELEAVKEWLVDNHKVLAPGAEEIEAGTYYSEYLNQYFLDLEEVYAFLEEKGLVESIYDEDGDLSKVYVNSVEATDKNGNLLAKARYEVTAQTGRKGEQLTKEDVASKLIAGQMPGVAKVLYTTGETKSTTLPFVATWKDSSNVTHTNDEIDLGSVVIVSEYKGEYEIVDVFENGGNVATANGYTHAGWATLEGNDVAVKGTAGKITVYETDKRGEVTKLATVAPTKVGKYAPLSSMVWDEVTGLFVKEENTYANFNPWVKEAQDANKDQVEVNGEYYTFTGVKGYFWNNEYELVDEENETYSSPERFTPEGVLEIGTRAFGIKAINAVEENPTDKYLLKITQVTGVNTKEGKVTLPYAGGKEVVVEYAEVDGYNYAAFNDMETLVKVAAKLDEFNNAGIKWSTDGKVYGMLTGDDAVEGVEYSVGYHGWYNTVKSLSENPWSGYTTDVLPKTELRGAASEACTYVIESKSEEVEATITSDADSVDTSVAGVKTLTLTAKVGEEVVSTKEVKVVVAPKYERTYVNGKVSVLKAFHLNGNLYAEYHYDWTAKTYTATFYAQDGVTVASTANGTL